MRRLALSVTLLFAFGTAAYATSPGQGWHNAGWYIAKNTPIKQAITIFGDYKTRDECETARVAPADPAKGKLETTDHGSITFECVYLDREPMR